MHRKTRRYTFPKTPHLAGRAIAKSNMMPGLQSQKIENPTIGTATTELIRMQHKQPQKTLREPQPKKLKPACHTLYADARPKRGPSKVSKPRTRRGPPRVLQGTRRPCECQKETAGRHRGIQIAQNGTRDQDRIQKTGKTTTTVIREHTHGHNNSK